MEIEVRVDACGAITATAAMSAQLGYVDCAVRNDGAAPSPACRLRGEAETRPEGARLAHVHEIEVPALSPGEGHHTSVGWPPIRALRVRIALSP